MIRIVRADVNAVAAPFPQPLRFGQRPLTTNTAVVVQLVDSAGAVGFGYAPTFGMGTAALESLIRDDFAPQLMGVVLQSAADAVRVMTDIAAIAGRPAGLVRQAIAILELCIWDLVGQVTARPLHEVWGQPTGAVRAYASGGWRHLPIGELSRLAGSWSRAGFGGVKIQVGLSPAEDVARVRAVREAVGPDVDIMLDANQRIPPDVALEWARALAPCEPTWLEEPIPADDHAGLATLRAAAVVAIAAGESESEPSALHDLLDRHAVDVLQPDVYRTGLGAAVEVAAASRAGPDHVSVSPHMAHELSAHVLSGVAGDGWLEYFDWFNDWWESPILPVTGRLTPSTVPGHGLRLRPGWLEAHRI
jgi:L-talarate/galactarate dehydratase